MYSNLPTNLRAQFAKAIHERRDEELLRPRQQTSDITVLPKRERQLHTKRCYTCSPKPYVARFMFYETDTIQFHFDLINRPYIIATPKEHVENIYDLSPDKLNNLMTSIQTFCNDRKIYDYQMSVNFGSWKHHRHLHLKIKIDESVYKIMKKDHFTLLNLQKNYPTQQECN